MRLHTFEWGEPEAPPLVCVHGLTGHGERFRQLAEERWAKHFRVIAVDLRGHGRSGWRGPWTIETCLLDLLETIDAIRLKRPDWVGHSFGGRLLVELAARQPERMRRIVLLDPAIQLPPRLIEAAVAAEMREPEWDSEGACFDSRDDVEDADASRALADLDLQLERLPDGRLRRRTCQAAVRTLYQELVTPSPPPEVLTMPVRLLYAPGGGIVTSEQASAYGFGHAIAVPGGHMVMWSAFDQCADAVDDS